MAAAEVNIVALTGQLKEILGQFNSGSLMEYEYGALDLVYTQVARCAPVVQLVRQSVLRRQVAHDKANS